MKLLAIDTETTGTDFFHGCKPFLVIACNGEDNYYWFGEVNPYTREVFWDENVIQEIQDVFDDHDKHIFHNTNFDVRALSTIGIHIPWSKVEDTLIAAHCINAAHDTGEGVKVGRSLGLKDLAIEYLHWWADEEEELDREVKKTREEYKDTYAIARKGHPHFPGIMITKWHKMDMWLCPELCLKYAFGDVERTFILWQAFKKSLIYDNLWEQYKLRRDLLQICYEIVSEGEDFDTETALAYIERLSEQKEELRQTIKNEAKIKYYFEPSKPAHIQSLLTTSLNIPIVFKTKKGNPETNKQALDYYFQKYESPALSALQKWKKIDTRQRYITSYTNWVADGKIHSNLNPTGTRETRQSSSAPNGQNRTKELDQFFYPQKDWLWWDADFDNIELRIWGYSVGNKEMRQVFDEGRSFHMIVFHELFPAEAAKYEKDKENTYLADLYRKIKGFEFGIIYGATEKKADETVGKKGSYNKLVSRFPEIYDFTKSLTKQVYSNLDKCGLPCIYTMGGYRLPVPINEAYKASNYYVQGSAGIITTLAMKNIRYNQDYLDAECRMYCQVHDSIRVKVPICRETEYLFNSLQNSMEEAGRNFIPSCTTSYKVIQHPEQGWPF